MSALATDPKKFTALGRLSFPTWTYVEALERNKSSDFPKTDDKVSPEFNLLLTEDELQRLRAHLMEVFLPYTLERGLAKEKSDALQQKYFDLAMKKLETQEWDSPLPHLPIKPISEKNKEAAPEAVASLKIIGPKAGDFQQKAAVYSEEQLLRVDEDVLTYPVLKRLDETVFEMYPGALLKATLNLYAYFGSPTVWGVSAGANTAVYMGNMEGERIGGGGAGVDADAIFND